MENNDIIRIVLAADDNYAQHLGVAMTSILENHKNSQKIEFFILDNNIGGINLEKIKQIGFAYKVDLFFYKISEALFGDYPEANRLSRATYSRIFIPELLPLNIKKVLYLDVDLVVLEDVALLYNTDLKNFSVGAVRDVMSKEILRIYFDREVLDYFNAGVLLINLEKWRQKKIAEKSLEFVRLNRKNIVRSDQDILNCLLKNDWLPLDKKFNIDLKRGKLNLEPEKNTVILHYSDKAKPWQYIFYGKSQKYYWQYLRKTPWADFNFPDKNFSNFILKYARVFIISMKRNLLPFFPSKLIDFYRKILWSTYEIK
jgi:lipopolysaccharide biosynthesis glycosyltransferase